MINYNTYNIQYPVTFRLFQAHSCQQLMAMVVESYYFYLGHRKHASRMLCLSSNPKNVMY